MNRKQFLSLFGLSFIGCKDELEDMNIGKKIWWLGSLSETQYDTPTGDATVTVNSSSTIVSGARWYGRTSMKVLSNGLTVMAYREADGHADNLDDVINVMFSEDYGATWTAKNTYPDSSAVTGMPAYPANATPTDLEGPGEPWLYLCPNGDLLIHMWSCDYGVTNQGTYQTRSTDNGRTWSAPALVTFVNNTGITISSNLNIFATDDDFVYNGVIYAGAREYQDVDTFDTAIRSWFIKSEDNGVTWELVSLLSQYGDVTNEYGMTYVGNNTIAAMMREFTTLSYQTRSTDFGATWSALTEISSLYGVISRQRINTRAQLKGEAHWWNDPVLIMNGFVHVTAGNSHPRRIAVWISKDKGLTWSAPQYMDAAGYDGGYGSVIYNPNTDEYVYTCYYADMGDTDLNDGVIKQYNFSLDFVDPGDIILSDDFEDGSINTAKWVETDPADGVTITEEGSKLKFTCNQASPVASTLTNNVVSHSDYNWNSGTYRVVRFTTYMSGGTHVMVGGIYVDSNNSILMISDNVSIHEFRIRVGGSTVYSVAMGLLPDQKALKIKYDSNNDISFYIWNGAFWDQIGTTQNYNIGNSRKIFFGSNSVAGTNGTREFDTFYMTDYNYNGVTP